MGKSKKIILAAILMCIAAFSVYSQNAVTNAEVQNSVTEESIVLLDGSSSNINQDTTYKPQSTASVFFRMIISLIIVVILIYGVLWFIRKKTNTVKIEDDYLRRAAYINIAPGKTVEVITLIDKAYLIGVTEDNITLLGEIHDDELIKAMNLSADKKSNTTKPATFSEVLDLFLVKGNKTKNIFTETENQVDNIFSENKTEE